MNKQIPCPVCGGNGFTTWVNNTGTSCGTCSKTCQHCNGTGLREIPVTNADHIRAMTDEELEPYILAIKLGFDPWCDHHCENEGDDGCDTCILNWLKQPYGGADHE